FKLCYRASPTDCNACFPDISPARFLARETFVRGMLGLADHFVSPSRFLAERYVDWGLSAERFSVIENGIDVAEAAPPRTLPDAKARRSRFAYFGQLTPYKGADVLIDAVTRIPDSVWGEDSILLIYGGNLERQPQAYKDKFAEIVERAGRRVRFCGAFQNHEMPNLMRSVDWVVMPSVWWENSPIVIQEAFFHGRPILASNLGGMAEKITDEVDGLHFRSSSPEDLVDCMVRALTEPGLWDRLRNGIKRPLSHRECAQTHLDLYRRLIAERSRPAPARRDPAAMIA
nr:glycosyltransferase family 4 protein [Bosea sp. (in: a-proteobacteria)]